jgi:cbb3-type cytochrome oxidase maturation protein
MSDSIMALMLGVSTFLGALGLIALLWGLRSGQFDDQSKFLDGARFDNEEELRDAVMMERKRKEAMEKKRRKETKNGRDERGMPAD